MQRGGRIIAGLVGAIGLTVFVGWYGGVRSLLTLIPEHGTDTPNTALGLLIVSLGVLALGSASSRRTAAITAAGAATFLIGALTLAEIIFGVFAGIDVILPGIDLQGDSAQMAPATAASLVVLGGALLGSLRTKPTLTLGLAYAALAVSEIAVLGYVYGVSSLYTVGGATSIALPTALCVMGLAGAILLQFPTHGIVGLARDQGSAGQLLRRCCRSSSSARFCWGSDFSPPSKWGGSTPRSRLPCWC